LIGNSRWHWAEAGPDGVFSWSAPPPLELQALELQPKAWAAVGVLPAKLCLDPQRRVRLSDVPLISAPPWLGLDRALAGWQARERGGCGALVADAGTALSLTRVSAAGEFAGGRLLAGASLQLQALASGTAALPQLPVPPELPADPWPQTTASAMAAGVLRGLAAVIDQAWREARAEDPACRLWLTGGDAPALATLLGVEASPQLALEALVALRPA
jgi:type III pantothenate kinase